MDNAQDIIEDIQRSYFLHPVDIRSRENGPDSNETKRQLQTIRRLGGTLDLISQQLYADITHFILEIVQNADDNEYNPNVEPTLHLELSRRELVVKCNEVGFTEANVRAICDVNASTKRQRKNIEDGCIGEKGIGKLNYFTRTLNGKGFKSIFSIADRVSIFSNKFSFCLDKRAPLGMVNPQLLPPPGRLARDGWTTFVMDLSLNDHDFRLVNTTLEKIQPEMLLFTRRLRNIRITTIRSTGIERNNYRATVPDKRFPSVYAIQRNGNTYDTKRYLVQAMRIDDMPHHPSRQDVTESELKLAFPFGEESGPICDYQRIFAFMPLRQTPFKFLVQGDFLTQTSREGLLEQDVWNIRLRDCIPQCFLQAISRLQEHHALRKNFIRFIPRPCETHRSDRFLESTVDSIWSSVKEMAIIRTRCESWVRPSLGLVVPKGLCFEDKPLFTEGDLSRGGYPFRYVDPDLAGDQKLLEELGCSKLHYELVCRIISSSFPFPEKSFEWLGHLFQYLAHVPRTCYKQCRSAKFLRLVTGEWTSARLQTKVYTPVHKSTVKPIGLQLPILDEQFYQSISKNSQAQFFLTNILGIESLTNEDLVAEIIRVHQGNFQLDAEACFNHATCLNRLRSHLYSPNQVPLFYVVDQKGQIRRSCDVVLDWTFAGNEHIGRKTLSKECEFSTLSFLSDKYSSSARDFLISFAGVPRFVPFTETAGFQKRPSSVYTDILAPERQGSNLILYYLSEIDAISGKPYNRNDLRAALKKLTFKCEYGSFAPISSCYVPNSELASLLTDDMNVLQIVNPDDSRWSILRELGVAFEPNLEMFLHQLRSKKTMGLPSDHTADNFYDDLVKFCLSARSCEVQRVLNNAFREEELLLAKPRSSKTLQWSTPDEVYLNCPDFVWFTKTINSQSSDMKYLCKLLGVREWDSEVNLKHELEAGIQELNGAPERWKFLQSFVFTALKSTLPFLTPQTEFPSWLLSVLDLPIFPVTLRDGVTTTQKLRRNIFVPDSQLLNSLFEGKVDMLDFGENHLWDILSLFQCSKLPMTYISSFNDPNTMEIKIFPEIIEDLENLNKIRAKKGPLTRLFYARGPAQTLGQEELERKWQRLRIMSCEGLEQRIIIPEFGIEEKQSRQAHIYGGEHVIYISRKSGTGRHATFYLSEQLAAYFAGQPELRLDINAILQEDDDMMDELLTMVLGLPELPASWIKSVSHTDEGFLQTDRDRSDDVPTPDFGPLSREQLVQNLKLSNLKEASENFEHLGSRNVGEISWRPSSSRATIFLRPSTNLYSEDVTNIMTLIDRSMENYPPVKEQVSASSSKIRTPKKSTAKRTKFRPIPITIDSKNRLEIDITSVPHQSSLIDYDRHNHTVFQTFPPIPSYSILDPIHPIAVIEDDEGNVKSGFAGEYFKIYSLLSNKLSNFSHSNWTSSLRKYAKFTPCEEGLADFEYEGDIKSLRWLLGLPSCNRSWRKIYVEVKSSVRDKDWLFHLTDTQFENIQRLHGEEKDKLYIIVLVGNALSRPQIIRVFEDPIQHMLKGELTFKTSGGIVGHWV